MKVGEKDGVTTAEKRRDMEIRDGRREQIKREWVCFWLHEFFKIFSRVVNRRECNSCYDLYCQRKSVLLVCVCVCVCVCCHPVAIGDEYSALRVITCQPQKQTDLRSVPHNIRHVWEDLYCKFLRLRPAVQKWIIMLEKLICESFFFQMRGEISVILFLFHIHAVAEQTMGENWRLRFRSGCLIDGADTGLIQ